MALEGFDVTDDFAHTLATGRSRDAAANRTLFGPHRQDLVVTHLDKQVAAASSSTGEQKALLIGIVLAHADLVAEARGQRPAALNALSDRLRAGMESRMRLVAAAGHDFRTPMTRMRLRAEFLADEERERWLTDLDELDGIADSAIKLVQEEGTGDDRKPLVLEQLVRETVEELQVAQLPVTLGTLDSASVMAGPLALRRALRNLITNAATHGGGARVKLEKLPEDTRIVIEDDGPGIPEAMLSQVFEPFFRANPARTQAIKGAGLGLAIAREIIERFGGTIEIRNRPEGGLEQVVRLKAVPAAV